MQQDTASFQDLHWLLDIIQSTDIGIVVVDRHFNIEIYNRFMQVHSNIGAEDVIGSSIFDVFPYLDDDWFKRRVMSVFDLGIPVYTTWEQRDSVFDFSMKLPIHHENDCMYQNTTFVPLRSSRDEVEKVGIVIYDVTDVAINSMKLEDAKVELLRLSRTDKLTSLWNRGYWEECCQVEFSRNKRSEEPISLVIFDIDHFKKVNDTYGHHSGDEAIKLVSQLLQDASRDVDICGRYGGEEYVVLLPNTDANGAKVFCERLRENIAKQVVECDGHRFQFTISLGIAQLDDSITDHTTWISSADKALYESKEGGRNQTNIYTP